MNIALMVLLIIVPIVLVMTVTTITSKKQKKLKKELSREVSQTTLENAKHHHKTSQKRISRLIGTAVLIPVLSTGIILFFTVGGCSSDAKTPIIVLEKESEKYVFHSNSFFLSNDIKKGRFIDLSMFSKVIIYPLKDGYYIDPNDIESFAAIATNQFDIIEYNQGTHEGFFVVSDSLQLTFNSEVMPTDKIGKSILQYTVSIKDKEKEMLIQWKKSDKLEPILNCQIRSIWEVSSPYAGKTVGNYRDKLLVNITDIMHYFNSNTQLYLEDEGELLTIRI